MERRQFTREFKLEAVRLFKHRGVSYAQASEDLGSSDALRNSDVLKARSRFREDSPST
jgi:transposase-like protein